DFEENSAVTVGQLMGGVIVNGSVYNNSTAEIGNITSNFVGNTAQSTGSLAYGGVIANYTAGTTATIGNITGDFTNNSLTSDTSNAYGGGIFNLGTIGDILGDFTNNTVIGKTEAVGGAIFNQGIMGTITNSSITGNSAISSDGEASGGAIYTSADLTISSDNGTTTIQGNYTESSGVRDDNAIYVDGATLTLEQVNGGQMYLYDNVRGEDAYNINITGDNTGTLHLFNDLYEANVTIDNTTVNTVDNAIREYSMGTLTSTNGKIAVDIDYDNEVADKFVTTGDATGTLYLSTLNLYGTRTSGTWQILDIAGGDAELAFGDNIKFIENGEEVEFWEPFIFDPSMVDNTVTFGDIYASRQGLRLATTDTTNDSIEINPEEVFTEILTYLNQKETTDERNFNFQTSGDVYTVTDQVGTTTEGILNINGVANENGDKSTIDFNGTEGFNVENATTLNINNTTLTNAANSAIRVTNENAEVNLNNVELTNNTSNTNGGAISVTAGEVTITNSAITGNSAISDTAEVNGGAIYTTQDITLTSDNGTTTVQGNSVGTDDNAIYVDGSTLTLNQTNNGKMYMYDNVRGNDYDVNITGDNSGTLYLYNDLYEANVRAGNTNINTINDEVHTYNFNSFTLTDNINMYVDMDLANETMDRITAADYGVHGGTLTVSGINLVSDTTAKSVSILFADEGMAQNVVSGVGEIPMSEYQSTVYTPIYKYNIGYNIHDDNRGYFDVSRGRGGSSDDFNPAVVATPVATQTAGQATMNQTFQYVFEHADAFTQMPAMDRFAMIHENEYALSTDYNNNLG
ncbi:MAG: hypothetical protein II085_00430, partial [Alphaproteobacteria bacterium]|nr:hypothetical protein [Alphaproteobacteria bacterium]